MEAVADDTANTATDDPVVRRLADQVRTASGASSALRIRGGGTKDFYGGEPTGAPLDASELRGISSYEPTEMVLTARAGTPLSEIEAALAEHNQHLAFEPPRFGPSGTVGGMLAAGLAGPSRAWVGGVRDFVLGASLLNGRGELLRFGGQVMKNVAGFDVSRVLAGSLGVLGVICEVSLKVPPVPARSATLRFSFDQAQAIERVQAWAGAALPVNASVWRDGTLHLRLAGAKAAVLEAVATLRRTCGAKALDDEEAAVLWGALRDQLDPFFQVPAMTAGLRLWRLSVPANSAPLALEGEMLIEWGGAQRWLRSSTAPEAVHAAATRVGGHAALFRCARRETDFLPPLSAELERLHRSLKASFDPHNVFNRGRLYSWL